MDDSKSAGESSEEMEHSPVETDDTQQEGVGESETNPTTAESQNLSPVGQDASAIHQLTSDSSTDHPIETDDTPQEEAEESEINLETLGSQISTVEQDTSVIHQLPADSTAERHLMEADDTPQEGAEESERNLATLGSQTSSSVEQDLSLIPQLPAELPVETPLEQDAAVIPQFPAELSTVISVKQDSSVTHRLPAGLSAETPEPYVSTSASVSLPLDTDDSDKTFSSKEPSGKRRRSSSQESDSDTSREESEPTRSMLKDSVILRKALESPTSLLTHSSKKRKMEEGGFSGPVAEEVAIESHLHVPSSAASIGPESDAEEKTPSPDSSADSRSQDDNSNPNDMHQSRNVVGLTSDEYGSSAEQSESGENSDAGEISREQSERSSDSGRRVAVLRDSPNPEGRSNVQNPTSEEDEEYMEEEGNEEYEEGVEEEGNEEYEEGIEEEEQSSVSSEERQSSSNMAHAAMQELESRANAENVATDQTTSDSLSRFYNPSKKAKKSFTSSKSTGFQRNVAGEALASRNLPETHQAPVVPMEDSGEPSLQRQDSEPFSIEASTSGERSGVREDLEPPHIDIHAGQPSSSSRQPLVDPNGSQDPEAPMQESGSPLQQRQDSVSRLRPGEREYLGSPSSSSYEPTFDPHEFESYPIDDPPKESEDTATQMNRPVMPKHIDNAHQILLSVFKEIMKFRDDGDDWLEKFFQYYICTNKFGRPEFNHNEQLMLLVYLNKARDRLIQTFRLGREELELEEHLIYTLEVLTRIAFTALSITMSPRASYNFYAIMESYKALRILHEKFSEFQGQHDLEEIKDEHMKQMAITVSDLINTKLLLSLENAFRQLLMHIGKNADQATLDEYEKELFEEDKKYLRGRFLKSIVHNNRA